MNDRSYETSGMPSAEEILAGATQGGVAPPAALTPHEDDGTVHRVPRGGFFPDVAPVAAQPARSASEAATALKEARAAFERALDDHREAGRKLDQARDALNAAEHGFKEAAAREHGL